MPANLPGDAPKPACLLGYHRQLSPSAAVKVSPICLGAMGFGTSWADFMGACDKEQSFKLLDYFYRNGGNFVDTAANYQEGDSERILGEWMKVRENRSEMVVATKYTSAWQKTYKDGEILSNYGGNNKKSLTVAVEASLERLQTSYIDLFYVHYWDFTTSIPELMNSLHHLVLAGKVLYLGICNTPAWIVSSANEYARQQGLTPFSVFQGQWSAADREIERDVLPMVNAEGMALAPFGVLGMGYFLTSEQRAAAQTKTEEAGEATLKKEGRNVAFVDTPRKAVVADTLDRIARARRTSLTSVALAWARMKGPYVIPILGGRKIEHLEPNIAALGIELTGEEIREIEKAVPFDYGYPQVFLGGEGGATGPGDVWPAKRLGHFDWVAVPQHPQIRRS